MEDAVPERVRLQPGDGVRRMIALARQHVVPLQDLVKNNPVEKPAKTDAQEEPRSPGLTIASGTHRLLVSY